MKDVLPPHAPNTDHVHSGEYQQLNREHLSFTTKSSIMLLILCVLFTSLRWNGIQKFHSLAGRSKNQTLQNWRPGKSQEYSQLRLA